MTFHEEQTETLYVSVVILASKKDYVAEVFIRDEDFVWHAVLRYQRMPTRSIMIRDTYAFKCRSPRPYRPGQACDGSITAPVYHLYSQLCQLLGVDPIAIYQEAYDDHILTQDQLASILEFAEWQGVEVICEWTQEKIGLVLESIHEANMHQLANVLEEKISV
jgi:hypothetical protein